MYLVDTELLTLEYFPENTSTKYAVLSHRWEREEVTLQDLQNNTAATKYGYQKFQGTCEQAKKEGLKYVWIDNCCIDKTSSADLSEAINSMFNWYRDASICLAYLADVGDVKKIACSVWFTRGWTLQELIAPREIHFFGTDWVELGTKTSLSATLAGITGVPATVLNGQESFTRLSVAQRMSWQAKREVTRTEDIAYSLMGIMDVNMPLLYGEGIKAFRRLQEEIIKQTDDHTIFAWRLTGDTTVASGLLAPSPKAFVGCSSLICREPAIHASTFTLTNRGLSIELPLIRWSYNFYIAVLNCVMQQKGLTGNGRTVGLFLRPLDVPVSRDPQYARVTLGHHDRVVFDAACFGGERLSFRRNPEIVMETFHLQNSKGPFIHRLPKPEAKDQAELFVLNSKALFIRQNPLDFRPLKSEQVYGFWLRKFVPFHKTNILNLKKDFSIRCWNQWDSKKRRALIPEGCTGAAFVIHVQGKSVKALRSGSSSGTPLDTSETTPGPPSSTDATTVMMPSMFFALGFDKEYRVVGALKTNPADSVVACMKDLRSDPVVLSDGTWNKLNMEKLSKTQGGILVAPRQYWKAFISVKLIDGVETHVVDLLWSGDESQCDECGKVITTRQYCCVECSQYDCCVECFKKLPKSRHDATFENRQHLFQTVLLGNQHGEGYSVLNKEQARRLERDE